MAAFREKFGPIFVHHCSRCNSCNLNMDHHCGFVNSCICVGPGGSAKPFFLFALYTIALCLNGAILIARRSIAKGETWTSMQSPLKCTLMLVTTVLRHILASTPYFDRETLGLFPLDEYG